MDLKYTNTTSNKTNIGIYQNTYIVLIPDYFLRVLIPYIALQFRTVRIQVTRVAKAYVSKACFDLLMRVNYNFR